MISNPFPKNFHKLLTLSMARIGPIDFGLLSLLHYMSTINSFFNNSIFDSIEQILLNRSGEKLSYHRSPITTVTFNINNGIRHPFTDYFIYNCSQILCRNIVAVKLSSDSCTIRIYYCYSRTISHIAARDINADKRRIFITDNFLIYIDCILIE